MTVKMTSIPVPVTQAHASRTSKGNAMGEVRVKVRLTNAVDAFLEQSGELALDKVRAYEADAVVDTGAVATVIPQHVADQLGVGIRGQRVTQYAHGRKDVVGVTFPILVEINGRDTAEECFVLGDEVLIGQTVLEKTDLLVNCTNQIVVPNPAHPDQPVLKVRSIT